MWTPSRVVSKTLESLRDNQGPHEIYIGRRNENEKKIDIVMRFE